MKTRPTAASAKAHSTSSSVHELLGSASLKRTRPREIVLELLLERHGPFSTEEIHDLLKQRKIDLVTIYRCMAAFEKAGIVRKCDFGDRTARYEIGAEDRHHHHVICRRCRRAESLSECIPPNWVSRINKMGYADVSHSLEFFGVCADCREN